jgi:hypothetical protein
MDKRKGADLDGKYPQMNEADFASGCAEIRKHLPHFDYSETLQDLNELDLVELYHGLTSGYEKVQVFRMLDIPISNEDLRLLKFINETYHVENDRVCQLDPRVFDCVPEYIVQECDRLLKESKYTS